VLLRWDFEKTIPVSHYALDSESLLERARENFTGATEKERKE